MSRGYLLYPPSLLSNHAVTFHILTIVNLTNCETLRSVIVSLYTIPNSIKKGVESVVIGRAY